MKKILLIIPAYNEEENIERVVDEIINLYPALDYVVINDGSRDNTASICRKHHYNLVDLPINLGLAGAFQAGMKYAYKNGYDYAVQFDGDGQHSADYISGMAEYVETNNLDVVIGSRFVTEKRPRSMRMLGNTLISFCIKLTTGKRINDPTSGMRMYSKRIIKILATTMNHGPEPDTIAYLLKCGAGVSEYQVNMKERIAGESYLNLTRSIQYMANICSSILLVQWFRRKEVLS